MSSPESESVFAMNHPKTAERQSNANVTLLLPHGFGFGDGKISTKEQLAHPEQSGLTQEAFETGIDIILHDERVFVAVQAEDDGCGDGRPVSVVYRMVPNPAEQSDGELREEIFNKSLPRAKVFGGGLIVASSMLRSAVWGEVTADDTVLTDRKKTVTILNELNIKFGAHTDNHAHGDNCGCGAIDKFPITIEKTLKYREGIYGVVRTYVGDAWNDEWEADFGHVYASYENQYSESYLKDAEGRKTMDVIEQSGAVVKELADDHLEDYDVLNDIDDTTFDQPAFDAIMHERGVEGTAQVFAVDVWRGRKYARAIAAYATKEFGLDYGVTYRRCVIDFLARSTKGPSVTLTDGSQPVFLRTAA